MSMANLEGEAFHAHEEGLLAQPDLGTLRNLPFYSPGEGEEEISTVPRVAASSSSVGSKRRAAGEASSAPARKNARQDSSLSVLTERFVEIIHGTKDGIVDITAAAKRLDVKKRRIYDITNVLQGIGLVRKECKSNVQWTGDFAAQNAITTLRDEVRTLQEEEALVEAELASVVSELEEMAIEDQAAKVYVSVDQVRGLPCIQNETIIVVRAPTGTTLVVPDPLSLCAEDRYRIDLRSSGGPIEVYILDDSAEPEPSLVDQPQDYFADFNLESGMAGDALLADPSDFYQLFPGDAGVSDYYGDDFADGTFDGVPPS